MIGTHSRFSVAESESLVYSFSPCIECQKYKDQLQVPRLLIFSGYSQCHVLQNIINNKQLQVPGENTKKSGYNVSLGLCQNLTLYPNDATTRGTTFTTPRRIKLRRYTRFDIKSDDIITGFHCMLLITWKISGNWHSWILWMLIFFRNVSQENKFHEWSFFVLQNLALKTPFIDFTLLALPRIDTVTYKK